LAQTKTTRGRAQDRAKVAVGQEYDPEYEAGQTEKSKDQVSGAVKSVGNNSEAVDERLGSK
jgi:hypothetical protein